MSETITKHLPFVKEQIGVQSKLAKRYKDQGEQWRENLHLLSAEKMKSLAYDIEETSRYIKELEGKQKANITVGRQLSLSFDEIQDLPEELMNELSISDADRTEFTISSILEESGGIASLDRILVSLFKKTGEVHKRTNLTNRLYRMSNKGMVFGVPGKKGVYSTQELTQEEVDSLFQKDNQKEFDEVKAS